MRWVKMRPKRGSAIVGAIWGLFLVVLGARFITQVGVVALICAVPIALFTLYFIANVFFELWVPYPIASLAQQRVLELTFELKIPDDSNAR